MADNGTASLESATETQAGRPAPPPLRIHHLLACAAVAALQLTTWRLLLPADAWDNVASASAARLLLFSTGQIIQAVALTVAIFSIYWHVQGYAALAQPGQWLLVALSISMLRWVSMPLFGAMMARSPWGRNVLLWSASDLFFAAMHCVAFFVAWPLPILFFGWLAWRIADTLSWRFLFALKALGAALVFFPAILFRYFGLSTGDAVTLLATTASVGMMACAVWAPVQDYRRRMPRAWTHWTGSGLFLAQYSVSAASFGLYYLNLF